MIGDHQRDSHSASRRATRSPYSASRRLVRAVPEGSLPAGRLEELGAELHLPLVHRRQPDVPVGGPLLHRMDDAVGLVEALGGPGVDVCRRLLVLVEARDVGAVQVDLRPAVGHPLGDGPGDPGGLLDPDRGGRPEALDLRGLAQDRHAVGGQREQAVDGVADADPLVAEDVGDELQGLLQLELEVLLGERQLRRGQGRGRDRGDVVGFHEDRPMRVRADLEVAAVLALVHVGVHVADDRERDLADRVRELRDRTHADHLVDRRAERDRRPGHPGDARAPDATGDDDDVRLDVALVRADPADLAVDDVDAR